MDVYHSRDTSVGHDAVMPPGGIISWLFGRQDMAFSSPSDRVRGHARAARGERRAESERRPGHPENPHWRGRLGWAFASPALPDDVATGGRRLTQHIPAARLDRCNLRFSVRSSWPLPDSGPLCPCPGKVSGNPSAREVTAADAIPRMRDPGSVRLDPGGRGRWP